MEVLEGNLLIIITWLAQSCFLVVWGHCYEIAFKRVFDFYRRGNRRTADWQAAKLIGAISAAAIVLYYVICMLLKYSGLPVYSVVMVVLVQLLQYLLLSGSAVENDVLKTLIFVSMVVTAPIVLSAAMVYRGVLLDKYYMHISAVLLVLCVIMYIRVSSIWKEGDLI
ncbi:MAG: hypothetical protein K2K56_15220 [Lachnospiraceae bacterium]|nr:hypothetical protein [Lachnospiraceae bacterium]MDE6627698.1 hypothetical protein [Lachnospiraceae bacterium]